MRIGGILQATRRRVARRARRYARPILKAVRPKRYLIATEGPQLKKSWAGHDGADLEQYLVSGYQNPRINAQSILARHFFIRKLFGHEFDDLMRAELAFCVEANTALHRRATELGVTMRTYLNRAKRAEILQVSEVIADREDTFEKQWAEELGKREVTNKLRVLEFACGSANDFRFLDAYGLARFLDYTGVDLNDANIGNARRKFPTVDFQVQSILDLPWKDGSFDYVIAFDIFEHLSIPAMETAFREARRLARQGVVVAFFSMSDIDEHDVRRRGTYHWNVLSAPKIAELARKSFTSVDMTDIQAFLRTEYGAEWTYNKGAWSLIAQR